MQVYLDGSFIERDDARISVGDRGFIFGDGIYEVIRCIEGKPFRADDHLSRLDKGLSGLNIELDAQERENLLGIGLELLERNELTEGEASIYLQVTRGTAWPRTHTFPRPSVSPTVYLAAAPFSPHTKLHETGVPVVTMADIRWSRCDLKTVNLLPNTLARERARAKGVDSAILIRDGVVTESPNANIFGVVDGTLRTFPECNYILSGITRKVVLEIAEEIDLPVVFNPIKQEELDQIGELFFSGTTTDIQPVTEIDGSPVGDGKPGPVVRKIQEAYRERLYG